MYNDQTSASLELAEVTVLSEKTIKLHFNRKLGQSAQEISFYNIIPEAEIASVEIDENQVTIQLVNTLDTGILYQINVGAIPDCQNESILNPLESTVLLPFVAKNGEVRISRVPGRP